MTNQPDTLDSPEVPPAGGFKLQGLAWAARKGLRIPPTHILLAQTDEFPSDWQSELIIRPSLDCRWEDAWLQSGRFPSTLSSKSHIRSDIELAMESINAEIGRHEQVFILIQPYYRSAIAGIAHVYEDGIDVVWDVGPNASIAAGLNSGHRIAWDSGSNTYACPTLDWEKTTMQNTHLRSAFEQLRRISGPLPIEAEWLVDTLGEFRCLQAQPAAPGSRRSM